MSGLLRRLGTRVTSLERRIARGTFQLPDRLGGLGEQVTDWNSVRSAGFYWSEDAANGPRTGVLVGVVKVVGGGTLAGRVVQEVSLPTSTIDMVPAGWRRVWVSNAWTAWKLFTGRTEWQTLAVSAPFTQGPQPLQIALTPTQVIFNGALYGNSTGGAFVNAATVPSAYPFPTSQVRRSSRHDSGMQIAITSAGVIQVLTTATVTTGLGLPLAGVEYDY